MNEPSVQAYFASRDKQLAEPDDTGKSLLREGIEDVGEAVAGGLAGLGQSAIDLGFRSGFAGGQLVLNDNTLGPIATGAAKAAVSSGAVSKAAGLASSVLGLIGEDEMAQQARGLANAADVDFFKQEFDKLEPDDLLMASEELREDAYKFVEDNLTGRQARPEWAKPDTLLGGFVEAMIQFIGPYAALSKTKLAQGLVSGSLTKRVFGASVVGAPVDALAFRGNEGNLSDFAKSVGLDTPLTHLLESKEGDSEFTGRLKNAVEGLIIGPFADGLLEAGARVARGRGLDAAAVKAARENGTLPPELDAQFEIDWQQPQNDLTGPERTRFWGEVESLGRSSEEIDANQIITDQVAAQWAAKNEGTVDDFYAKIKAGKDVPGVQVEDSLDQPISSAEISARLDEIKSLVEPTGARGRTKQIDVLRAVDKMTNSKDPIDATDFSPEAQAVTTDALHKDALEALADDEALPSLDWYRRSVEHTFDLLEEHEFPGIKDNPDDRFMFLLHLASGSDQATVPVNLKTAIKSFKQYKKSGKIKLTKTGTGSNESQEKLFKLVQEIHDQEGPTGLRELFHTELTVREIREAYGVALSGEAVDETLSGAMMLGPKLGSFLLNLDGSPGHLTMDRWMVRTWNRLRGNMVKEAATIDDDTFKAHRKQFNGAFAEDDAHNRKLFRELKLSVAKARTSPQYLAEEVFPALHRHYARSKVDARDGTSPNKSGYNEKTTLNKLAKTADMNLNASEQIMPRGAKERVAMRAAMREVVDRLQNAGHDIDMAALQALLWYNEKLVFSRIGASKAKDTVDYADAAAQLYGAERPAFDAREYLAESRGDTGGSGGSLPSGASGPEQAGGTASIEADSLNQQARGRVTFTEDGPAVIQLFESADASTLTHELSHVFRRVLSEIDPELQARADKFVGAESGGKWTRAQEEKWASSWETYLQNGKAPRPELQAAFDSMKRMLTEVYQAVLAKGTYKVKPEIRDIFDDMLGGRVSKADVNNPTPSTRTPNTKLEGPAASRGRFTDAPVRTTARIHVEDQRALAESYARPAKSPAVGKAYTELTEASQAHFEGIVDDGVRVVISRDAEPYASAQAMADDIEANGRMYISAAGATTYPKGHPLGKPSGVKVGDVELTHGQLLEANSMYYGHASGVLPFNANGREAAAGNYLDMLPGEAQRAYAFETRARQAHQSRTTMSPYDRGRNQSEVQADGDYVVSSPERRAQFLSGLKQTAEQHKFGVAVEVKDEAFYSDPANKLFLSGDGSAGVAVTESGDLVSVFKVPGSKVDINPLLAAASRESKTLDNFDIGGKLPELYAPHGFRPVARVAFNDKYAPDGWPYDLAGRPDVVLMVRDTTGASGLAEVKKGEWDSVRETLPVFDDWDAAAKLQQAAVAKVEASNRPRPGMVDADRVRNADDLKGSDDVELGSRVKETTDVLMQSGMSGRQALQTAVATHTNIDKLDATDDAIDMILSMEQFTQKEIDSLVGDVQTLDEVRAQATEMGSDPLEGLASLKKASKDTRRLASKIVFGRMLKVSLSEKAAELVAKNASEGEIVKAMNALYKVDVVLGAATKEIARATGSGRIKVPGLDESLVDEIIARMRGESARDEALTASINAAIARGDTSLAKALQAGGEAARAKRFKKVANALADANKAGASGKLVRRMRGIEDPTLLDAFLEVYKAGLLSGFKTITVNIGSGGIQTYLQSTARLMGSATRFGTPQGRADFAESARFMVHMHGAMADLAGMLVLNRSLTGRSTPNLRAGGARTIGQESPNLYGDFSGTGLANSATESKKAIVAKTFGASDDSAVGKGINFLGRAARLPYLANMLGEEWWGQVNYLASVRSRAVSEAKHIIDDANLTPAQRAVELQRYVENYVENSFDEFGSAKRNANGSYQQVDAVRQAQSANFMQDLEHGVGQWILEGKDKFPLMDLILPFIKAPTNLFRTSLRYAGLGGVENHLAKKAGVQRAQWEKDKNRGELMLGGALMGFAALLAGNDRLTGGGPVNPAEREALMATGWQPYSYKYVDESGRTKYISYSRVDPQATIFGMVSDITALMPYMDTNEQDQAIKGVLAGMAQNFASKTYMRGLSDALEAVMMPDRYGKKYLFDLAANSVPFSSFGRMANGVMDDEMRVAYTLMDAVKARVPGMSEDLPPRRDIFGQPITTKGGHIPFVGGDTVVGKMASPLAFSEGSTDAARNEMARLQVGFSMPAREMETVDLTLYETASGQNAYDRYQELVGTTRLGGRTVSDSVNRLVASPAYRSLPEPTGEARVDRYNPRVQAIQGLLRKYREAAKKQLKKEVPEVADEIRRRKVSGTTGTLTSPANSLSVIDRLLNK